MIISILLQKCQVLLLSSRVCMYFCVPADSMNNKTSFFTRPCQQQQCKSNTFLNPWFKFIKLESYGPFVQKHFQFILYIYFIFLKNCCTVFLHISASCPSRLKSHCHLVWLRQTSSFSEATGAVTIYWPHPHPHVPEPLQRHSQGSLERRKGFWSPANINHFVRKEKLEAPGILNSANV